MCRRIDPERDQNQPLESKMVKEHNASSPPLDDALFCEEEQWEDDDDDEHSQVYNYERTCLSPLLVVLLEHDLFWEDEELRSLFSREKAYGSSVSAVAVSSARREAVEWVLKVNARYGFTALTAVLAINYLDRFLCSVQFQRDKPWMVQLVAVTCLSLAAKVEETQVPLLLDLQVEDTKYVFEAKTIQRMEILILSTLQWKMHPVTPISFLDHIIRRLGLKTHLHWEFLRRCERLLLSAVSDSRSVCYLPSVVAAATMMNVIDQVDPCNAVEYRYQLLGVMKMSKESVNRCYELISELSLTNPRKRKSHEEIPGSPIGVIDASLGSECSNNSWSSTSSSSVYSSAETEHALLKKSKKTHQQEQKCLTSVSRVLVDFVGSPR